MKTTRIILRFNSAACYGYSIAQLVANRDRCLQEARNARYSKGPGWVTELPYNVMMARKYNHEIIGQLKMLQAHMRATRSKAMTMQELSYALAKQVPDIAVRAVFETSYGALRLDSKDSAKVAALVEKLLQKKLRLP